MRDGPQNLNSLLYADDAIFIEPRMGLRPDVTVTCWEHLRNGILGFDALNDEKLREEGEWQESHILLGFQVNVNSLEIPLPSPKVSYAKEVVNLSVFSPGDRIIPVKRAQELRGLVTHWGHASRFWKYWSGPLNALLQYADSTDTWIRCYNAQIMISFWNLVKLIRSLSRDTDVWPKLFKGSLLDAISMDQRLCSNNPPVSVTWITGAAVLNQFAVINWSRREYVIEETGAYIDEVSPGYRRTIIGDAEQLAASWAIVVWGGSEQIMLLGTDNQNVLAWTSNGYAKQGAALVLNQETPKWIAKKNIAVEGFYLRSGRNFSADWMSRSDVQTVVEWAGRVGFTRIRFNPYWNEFIRSWRHGRISIWNPKPNKVILKPSSVHGCCVDWNSSGGVVAQAAFSRPNLVVRYLFPRHNQASREIGKHVDYHPYVGGTIALMGGSAQTEPELQQFLRAVATYCPETSVLMTPFGISMHQSIWTNVLVIDGASYGDVIAGVWQVGIISNTRLRCFDEGRSPLNFMETLADRYKQCGLRTAGDARGIIDTVEIVNSSGIEVWIRDELGKRRLSINSGMRIHILHDIQIGKTDWPLCLGDLDQTRELANGGKCAVLCNSLWWMGSNQPKNWEVDTLRRSTPLTAWQMIADDVFDTRESDDETMNQDDGKQEEDRYDFPDDNEQGVGWSDHLNSAGTHWPRAQYYYTPTFGREEHQFCGEMSREFRAGTKQINELPKSWSGNPKWENAACLRRKNSLGAYGYPPYVDWGTLSDTADSLYEEVTTGNLRLPPWKIGWDRFKERGVSWFESWCVNRDNAESHELKLDSLIIENCVAIRKDRSAGRRSYVEPSLDGYRRGANLDVSAPHNLKTFKRENSG